MRFDFDCLAVMGVAPPNLSSSAQKTESAQEQAPGLPFCSPFPLGKGGEGDRTARSLFLVSPSPPRKGTKGLGSARHAPPMTEAIVFCGCAFMWSLLLLIRFILPSF